LLRCACPRTAMRRRSALAHGPGGAWSRGKRMWKTRQVRRLDESGFNRMTVVVTLIGVLVSVVSGVALLAVLSLTPSARAGFIDDLGTTFGLDTGVLGALLGIAFIVAAVLLLAMFRVRSNLAFLMVIVSVGIANIVLGFWPSWGVLILAVSAGGLAWSVVMSGKD